MDKRVQDALAEAPEMVRYPEPQELAEECQATVERFIMTLRRAAATPRRFPDRAEQRADKGPVNKLAWSMMMRYAAWAKATGIERRFKRWDELNLIPYGESEEEVEAERSRIMRLDVGDWIAETRTELTRLLGLAAVGRHRLKDKRYGSLVSRLLLDLQQLDSSEERWRAEVNAVLADAREAARKVEPDDVEWDAVERMDV